MDGTDKVIKLLKDEHCPVEFGLVNVNFEPCPEIFETRHCKYSTLTFENKEKCNSCWDASLKLEYEDGESDGN